jgi:hypothetical protein
LLLKHAGADLNTCKKSATGDMVHWTSDCCCRLCGGPNYHEQLIGQAVMWLLCREGGASRKAGAQDSELLGEQLAIAQAQGCRKRVRWESGWAADESCNKGAESTARRVLQFFAPFDSFLIT